MLSAKTQYGPIDTANQGVLQELKPLQFGFFVHHLDYLVVITVETE
jgi:hypothetical protein